MLRFQFRINHSFLSYPSHPITVPKSQVSYTTLAFVVGAAREGIIHFPDHSIAGVRLNHSVAGFGEYYQLRVSGPAAWASRSARHGELVTVEITARRAKLDIALSLNN